MVLGHGGPWEVFMGPVPYKRGFPVAQMVKNPPAMQEIPV